MRGSCHKSQMANNPWRMEIVPVPYAIVRIESRLLDTRMVIHSTPLLARSSCPSWGWLVVRVLHCGQFVKPRPAEGLAFSTDILPFWSSGLREDVNGVLGSNQNLGGRWEPCFLLKRIDVLDTTGIPDELQKGMVRTSMSIQWNVSVGYAFVMAMTG